MPFTQRLHLDLVALILLLGQRTSRSSASVTPRQADRTTPRRFCGCASRMSATRSKQAASATLEPPNLCTTQRSVAWEWGGNSGA